MKKISNRKLARLHKNVAEAKFRYQKINAKQASITKCSPKCAMLMHEKRTAKLNWLIAELELKEYKLQFKPYTT